MFVVYWLYDLDKGPSKGDLAPLNDISCAKIALSCDLVQVHLVHGMLKLLRRHRVVFGPGCSRAVGRPPCGQSPTDINPYKTDNPRDYFEIKSTSM